MAGKIKDDNYIVIPARARLDYNLKGNDLLVYGIIHGFTHDNFGWKELSLQYVCDWIGVSDKSRVSIIINRLVESGAIEKEDYYVNNVKFCRYRVKPLPRSENHNGSVVESTTGGVVESTTHNNIGNIIEDNIFEDNYSSSRTINSTSNNNNISSTTPKNSKKGLDLSFVGVEFADMFCRYIAYRKEIHKPLTQSSAEAAYRKLQAISNGDARVADAIIEQSIANGWQGLFELKQTANGNNSTTAQQPRNRFCDLARSITAAGGIL